MLRSLGAKIARHTPIPISIALALVGVGIVVFLVGAVWLVGPKIAAQADTLREKLPQAIHDLQSRAESLPVIKRAIEHAPPIGNAFAAHEGIFSKITGVVSLAFDVGIEAFSVIAPAPIWPRSRRSTSLECHGSSRPRIGGVYAIFSTSSEQRWAGGSLASRSRWCLSEC
jgi:hypothetical protein